MSLLVTVLELSRATFSFNVYHCILLVSLYVIYVIFLFGMFIRLDYSSALEYSIIRRYTNIVYYYYEIRIHNTNNMSNAHNGLLDASTAFDLVDFRKLLHFIVYGYTKMYYTI